MSAGPGRARKDKGPEARRKRACDFADVHSPTPSQDRADASSLKLLQVPELLAWVGDKKLTIPKWKHKDGKFIYFHPRHANCRTDLIAIILSTTEFKQVSKSDIKEIVEKVFQSLSSANLSLTYFQRKLNKSGPPKQLAQAA